MPTESIAKAKENPSRVFETPAEIVAHPQLSFDKKMEILKNWEQEAHQLQAAEEESMVGGEPTRLAEIRNAIDKLQKVRAHAH